jgi:hypothetical protein
MIEMKVKNLPKKKISKYWVKATYDNAHEAETSKCNSPAFSKELHMQTRR